MTAPVVPLRPSGDGAAAAREALAAVHRHLDRCKLSAGTVKAYKRQTAAYAAWLAGHAADHGDTFADLVGPEGAPVPASTARRRRSAGRPAGRGRRVPAVRLGPAGASRLRRGRVSAACGVGCRESPRPGSGSG